jgi:outer membrane protein assembly factor BamB
VRGDWIEVGTVAEADVIDLGELSDDLPRPISRRRLPRLGSAQRRVLAAIVLVAAAFAQQGSAVGARPPLGPPLWTMQISFRPMITPDALIVRAVNADHFSARDRTTGRELWTLGTNGLSPYSVDQYRAGGPMVASLEPELADTTSAPVEVIEPVHGRVLATAHGGLVGFGAGGDVAVLIDSGDAVCPPGTVIPPPPDNSDVTPNGPVPPTCTRVSAIDGRTGRTLWQRDSGLGGDVQFERVDDEGLLRSVTVELADGSFTVYDPATGGELWQGSTAPRIMAAIKASGGQSITSNGRQVLMYADGGQYVAEAYAPGESTPRWHRVLSSVSAAANNATGGLACGRYVCLYAGGGMVMVDVATGALVLRTPYIPSRLVGPDTVLLIDVSDQSNQETLTLIDLRTGQRTGPLTIDDSIYWPHAGPRLLGQRQVGAQRTLFVGDASGRFDALGRIAGSSPNPDDSQCIADGDTLACADANGHLRVWRLPV